MKPYTKTGEKNCQEDLRRGGRRGSPKRKDRANKKTHRTRLKRTLSDQCIES